MIMGELSVYMHTLYSSGPYCHTDLKRGDRVVACFDIACGDCDSCKTKLFTACDTTNDSRAQEFMYGDKSGG